MKAQKACMDCLRKKQEKRVAGFSDGDKKRRYLDEVEEILCRFGKMESSPALSERIDGLFREFWGETKDFSEEKRLYNRLLLDREEEFFRQAEQNADPIGAALRLAVAGNYIDTAAVENVNETTLALLLERAETAALPEKEVAAFTADLAKAKRLTYLTDNAGEIVLDKVLLRVIRKRFPNLSVTVVVRGANVDNDASMEDAKEVGLTALFSCVGNGNAAPGTVLDRLSEEAKEAVFGADVLLAKGQANFESLYGEGLSPYYLFLCKCEHFTDRFGLSRFGAVFANEERIRGME